MGKGLLEWVPNFSEGRRPEVVDAIRGAIERCRGVAFLHATSDPTHNRTVLTCAGSADALVVAARAAAGVAAELIDLNWHEGIHPRIGALDVCPFVPLVGHHAEGGDMELARDTARRLAEQLADELGIPCYLYGEAAECDAHVDLGRLRRGGFEALREASAERRGMARTPESVATQRDSAKRSFDRGGPVHPTAGACAVGARNFLVAYNIQLDCDDAKIARTIARRIRERDGGLPGVKALGLDLAHRGLAQVSMNLVDYRRTSILAAYRAVEAAAHELGTSVRDAELIGLVPQDALSRNDANAAGLAALNVETRWLEPKLSSWVRL